MPKTRAQKEAALAELSADLGKQQMAVLTHYHGLTVRDLQELRAKLREHGMKFTIVKNTLFARAAKEAGITVETVEGPLAVAVGFDDAVQTAKTINQFSKDHEALEIMSGIFEGKQVDAAMVQKLANLPGREELLGRLIGSIGGPTRNLAGALSAISRNLVYALRAVQEQKA